MIAALIAAMAVGGFVFMFVSVQGLNRRAGELVGEFALKGSHEERERSIRNILTNTEAERSRLSTEHVVKADGVVSFIEEVERLGTVAGVDISVDTIEVAQADNADGVFEPLLVRFRTTGTWQQVFHVLTLVESLPLPISYSNIRLESSGGGSASLWRGTFGVSVLKIHE